MRNVDILAQTSTEKLRFILKQDSALNDKALEPESVDLTVTSPPYNVGKPYSGDEATDLMAYEDYLDFTRAWIKNCYLWTRDTGRLCINVGLDMNKGGKAPVGADVTKIAMECGWKYHATVIWNEGNISRRTAWGSWMSASAPHIIAPVEVIIILYKKDWKKSYRGVSDISDTEFKEWVLGLWTFNGESAKRIGHEAPFPRELPERCIKLFSYVGDTVLDPFVGSGTTMIEAINGQRCAIGLEIEEKYCALTRRRILDACDWSLREQSVTEWGN